MNKQESKKKGSYFPRSYGSGARDKKAGRVTEPGPPAASERPAAVRGPAQQREPAVSQESQAAPTDSGAITEPLAAPDLESDSQPSTVCVSIIGLRFNYAGKIYNFDTAGLDVEVGDWVIVKTEKGMGLGLVVLPPVEREIEASAAEGLRKIVRKAGKVDFDQKARCSQRENQAYNYCLEKIEELGLLMKLAAVECHFDGSKYVFYFTAEGRVDFRELVKHLVARYPVRIEMRQIGVRHEAKMLGGLGCCGQELCCSRFLTDFKPVSVKMAKNQNLSLNPSKISGVCGRLMCCLAYEHEIYEEFKKCAPRVGKMVKTAWGEGSVQKLNPLTQTVTVKLDEDTMVDVRREEISGLPEPPPQRREGKGGKGKHAQRPEPEEEPSDPSPEDGL